MRFMICFMKPILILLTVICLLLTIDYKNECQAIEERFYRAYEGTCNLNEFCGENNSYKMQIQIEDVKIEFSLSKGDQWSGLLVLNDGLKSIEKIPVHLEGEDIIIETIPQKRISADIFLFNQFDKEKCVIERTLLSIDQIEGVTGTYPKDEMEIYMKKLYNELLSNLAMFDKDVQYFESISNLYGFEFDRYSSPEHKKHSMKLMFLRNGEEANEDITLDDAKHFSLSLQEITPIAW